ncbi:MAG: hypothetical protein JXR31_01790 [Prolixibacteraceae bacterium]|nr:hypothetical protein [Prolixibacteraceae bacterium]
MNLLKIASKTRYRILFKILKSDVKTFVKFYLLTIIFHGCVIYQPHSADIPLINEKNELKIDAGVTWIPSATATVSYGVSNKTAAQVYGMVGADKRRFIQGAVGRYKNLPNQKVMEWYLGYGLGHESAYYDPNPRHLYSNYQLYFTQFNLGKINAKFAHSDFGFSIKQAY